ncbi:hypothetical protein RI367_006840 [Sorochytrium milnesiophthora]
MQISLPCILSAIILAASTFALPQAAMPPDSGAPGNPVVPLDPGLDPPLTPGDNTTLPAIPGDNTTLPAIPGDNTTVPATPAVNVTSPLQNILQGICNQSISINQTAFSEWETEELQWEQWEQQQQQQQNGAMSNGGKRRKQHHREDRHDDRRRHDRNDRNGRHHKHKDIMLFSAYQLTLTNPGLCSVIASGQGSNNSSSTVPTGTSTNDPTGNGTPASN